MVSYDSARKQAISRSRDRWRLIRSRGRRRYICLHGVVRVGGLMAASLCAGQVLFNRAPGLVLLAIVGMSAIGGYVIGVGKWKYNEMAYLTCRDEEMD